MIESAVRERSEALVRTLLESVRIASVSLTGEGIADQVGFLEKRRAVASPMPEPAPVTTTTLPVNRSMSPLRQIRIGLKAL